MKILDVVALIEDLPEQNLCRGQVGTIVEVYEPETFEVEFVNLQGKTYAVEILNAESDTALLSISLSNDLISKVTVATSKLYRKLVLLTVNLFI